MCMCMYACHHQKKKKKRLLTRNIKIQGDAQSVDENYGGHIIMRKVLVSQYSGVEFTRMGQQFILGRYPVVQIKKFERKKKIKGGGKLG